MDPISAIFMLIWYVISYTVGLICLIISCVAFWRIPSIFQHVSHDGDIRVGVIQLIVSIVDLITVPMGLVALVSGIRTAPMMKALGGDHIDKSQGDHDLFWIYDLRLQFVFNFFMIFVDLVCYLVGIIDVITIIRAYPTLNELFKGGNDGNDRRAIVMMNLFFLPVDLFCYLVGVFNVITLVRAYPTLKELIKDCEDANDRRTVVIKNLALLPVDLLCYLMGVFNTITIIRVYPMFRDLKTVDSMTEDKAWERRTIVAQNFCLVFVDLVCYLLGAIITLTLFRAYFFLSDLKEQKEANERRITVGWHFWSWCIDLLCLPAFTLIIVTLVRIPSMIFWLKNKEEVPNGVFRRLIVILHIFLIPFDWFFICLGIIDVALIWRAKKVLVELKQWYNTDPKQERRFWEWWWITLNNFFMTLAEIPVMALFLVLVATVYRFMDTIGPIKNATSHLQGGPSMGIATSVKLSLPESNLVVTIKARKRQGNNMPVSDKVVFTMIGPDRFWYAFANTMGASTAKLARLVMPYQLPKSWVDLTPYNEAAPGEEFELQLNVPIGMTQDVLAAKLQNMEYNYSEDVNFYMGLPKGKGVLMCFKAPLKAMREAMLYDRELADVSCSADDFITEPEPFIFYKVFVINVLAQFVQLIIDLFMLTLALITTCFIWRAPMLWGLLLEDSSMFPKRLIARSYEDLRIKFRVKMPELMTQMEKEKNDCKIRSYQSTDKTRAVIGEHTQVKLHGIHEHSKLMDLLSATYREATDRGGTSAQDPMYRMKSILEMKNVFDAFDVQLDSHYNVAHNIDNDTYRTYKEMLSNVEQMIDADIHHVVDEYYDLGKRSPLGCGCGFKDRDASTNRQIITLSLLSAILDVFALAFALFLIFTMYRAKLFISRLKLGKGLSEKKKIVFGEIIQVGWDILALLTSVFLLGTLFKALDMITIWTDAWEDGEMEEARFKVFELMGDFFSDLLEAIADTFCSCTNIGLCCASTCVAICVPGGLYFAVFSGESLREDENYYGNDSWMRNCCSTLFACGFWFFFTFFPFIYLYGSVADMMEGLNASNVAEVASSINTGMFTYVGLVFFLVLILLPSLSGMQGMTEFPGGADPANPPALNWANMNARIHLILDTLQLCAFTFSVADAIPFPLPVRESAKSGSSVALFDFGVTSTVAVFFLVLSVIVLWVYLTSFPIVADGIDIGDIDRKDFTDNSAWRLTIKMLTGTFFISILTNLLKVLRCVPQGSKLVMESDPAIVCWEGTHFGMALLAMLAISFFVPTATIVSAFFNHEKESDKLDYQFLHLYNIMLTIMKMFLSAALFFLADNIWAYLVVLLLLNLLMLGATAGFPLISGGKHVCVYPSFSNWRAATFAAGAWSTICSMWALSANDETDYVSAYALLIGWGLIVLVTFIVNIFVKKAIRDAAVDRGFLPKKELIQLMMDLRDRTPRDHFLEAWKVEEPKWEKALKKSSHPKTLGQRFVTLVDHIEVGAYTEKSVLNGAVHNPTDMEELKKATTNAYVAQLVQRHLDSLNPVLVPDIESGSAEQSHSTERSGQAIYQAEAQVDGHKQYVVVFKGLLQWFHSKKDFEKNKDPIDEMKTEHMLRVWMGDSVAMFGTVDAKHAHRHIVIDTQESEHVLDCTSEETAHEFYNAILEAGWHQVRPGLDTTEPLLYTIGMTTGEYQEGVQEPVVVDAVPVTQGEAIMLDAEPVRDDSSESSEDSMDSLDNDDSTDVDPMLDNSNSGGGRFGKLFGAAQNLANKNANLKEIMETGKKVYSEGKKIATEVRNALGEIDSPTSAIKTVNNLSNKLVTKKDTEHLEGILLMNRYLAEKWIALSVNGDIGYADGITVGMGRLANNFVGSTTLFERSLSVPLPAEFGWDRLYMVIGADLGEESINYQYVFDLDAYVVDYFDKPPARLLLEDEHIDQATPQPSSAHSVNSSSSDIAMETIAVEGGSDVEEIPLESSVSEATRRREFADQSFWDSMIDMHEHPEQMAKFLGRYMHTEELELTGKRFMEHQSQNYGCHGRVWYAFDITNLRGRTVFLRFITKTNVRSLKLDRVAFVGDVESIM